MQAIERGEGSGDNWAEYQQRLKQAESDAVTFAAAEQEALQAKQVCSHDSLGFESIFADPPLSDGANIASSDIRLASRYQGSNLFS